MANCFTKRSGYPRATTLRDHMLFDEKHYTLEPPKDRNLKKEHIVSSTQIEQLHSGFSSFFSRTFVCASMFEKSTSAIVIDTWLEVVATDQNEMMS